MSVKNGLPQGSSRNKIEYLAECIDDAVAGVNETIAGASNQEKVFAYKQHKSYSLFMFTSATQTIKEGATTPINDLFVPIDGWMEVDYIAPRPEDDMTDYECWFACMGCVYLRVLGKNLKATEQGTFNTYGVEPVQDLAYIYRDHTQNQSDVYLDGRLIHNTVMMPRDGKKHTVRIVYKGSNGAFAPENDYTRLNRVTLMPGAALIRIRALTWTGPMELNFNHEAKDFYNQNTTHKTPILIGSIEDYRAENWQEVPVG